MTTPLEDYIVRENESALIAFLKSLSSIEKKELTPEIKKLLKHYTTFRETKKGSWSYVGSTKQHNMLQLAAFVCYNRVDYEKTQFSIWILDREQLKKVITWYCPSWFSDFVNRQGGKDFIPHHLDYECLMWLKENDFLQPSNELLARTLVNVIFSHEGNLHYYKPEVLLRYPETLDEHVWLLFDVETHVHYAGRWIRLADQPDNQKVSWMDAFNHYINEGKLDRQRLLKESLLASNKNFNKVLSGWFVELFETLTPTNDEILEHQKEMTSLLSSQHSKPVNTVLQYFKKVVTHKNFDVQSFIDEASILLSNEAKNVVTATLMILEKLAKLHPASRLSICSVAAGTFIHNDENLQAKAVKLIMTYKNELPPSFTDELTGYYHSMLSMARNSLGDTLQPSKEVEPEEPTFVHGKQEKVLIPTIDTLDDLVFLASQAFDNNECWHFDVLPAALIQYADQFKASHLSRLEPALQRALQLTKMPLNSRQGYLDHMLAVFFIDVCIHLIRYYGSTANDLKNLFKKFKQRDEQKVYEWFAIKDSTSYIATWTNYGKDPFYLPYKQLLLHALDNIRRGTKVPVLCTPTNYPGYLNATVLIDRLKRYQQSSTTPSSIDFQIALSRLYSTDAVADKLYADKTLTGEWRNIMLFLFEENAEPVSPFENKTLWMCASLAKTTKTTYSAFADFTWYKNNFSKYTGQRKWKPEIEHYTVPTYDYTKKGMVETSSTRKVLKLQKPEAVVKEDGMISKIISKVFSKKNIENDPLLFDYFEITASWLGNEYSADMKRLIMLAPNNPEPLLAVIVSRCLRHPTFWEESSKKMVISALQVMHEIWHAPGEMAHLFIAASMVASDKTVGNIAGEIWIKAVSNKDINNKQIGEILGILLADSFVPLKRFTHLAGQQLMRISIKHNEALLEVVENILLQISDEPINNLRKLLEVYGELLQVNDRIYNEALESKLASWKSSNTLKKVIENLAG